jgi:chromate reductase
MNDEMRIMALSGSLRSGSYNTALIRAASELAPRGMTIESFDLRGLPMYDDDVRLAGYPAPVVALREAIASADGVLMASPEYNRSVPAILKNAIDWASRGPNQPFAQKPIALFSASQGSIGGAFANHHLRQILVYLDAQMVNGPEVLVSSAKSRFDENGVLIDESVRAFIAAHLVRFADLIRRWRHIL